MESSKSRIKAVPGMSAATVVTVHWYPADSNPDRHFKSPAVIERPGFRPLRASSRCYSPAALNPYNSSAPPWIIMASFHEDRFAMGWCPSSTMYRNSHRNRCTRPIWTVTNHSIQIPIRSPPLHFQIAANGSPANQQRDKRFTGIRPRRFPSEDCF